jgi:hypothetical protein
MRQLNPWYDALPLQIIPRLFGTHCQPTTRVATWQLNGRVTLQRDACIDSDVWLVTRYPLTTAWRNGSLLRNSPAFGAQLRAWLASDARDMSQPLPSNHTVDRSALLGNGWHPSRVQRVPIDQRELLVCDTNTVLVACGNTPLQRQTLVRVDNAQCEK